MSGRPQQPQSGPSFPLGRKLCWPWSLASCPVRGETKEEEEPPGHARGQPAGPQAPRTLDNGDKDRDPERGQSWALQVTRVRGISRGAALNGQHEALVSWLVE